MNLANCCSAFVFVLFSLIVHGLHLVGMATPYWVTTPAGHFGLWQYCQNGVCDQLPESFYTERWRIAQGLSLLSVVLGLLANALIVLRKLKEDSRLLYGFSATFLLLAGTSGLLGVTLLCVGGEAWGFSFYFVLVPCSLFLLMCCSAFFHTPKI